MAKKKYSNVNNEVNNSTAKSDSMVSKVEIKTPQDQDKVSRVVGTIFILLGLVLISYGIYSFVRYNRNPELDSTLQAPSLSGTEIITNGESIVIKGLADGYDDVFVYVDDIEVGRTKVGGEGEFEYAHQVADEGKYKVAVAGVRGFPKRIISPLSDSRVVEVDRTAPVLVSVDYKSEVGTETFRMVGEVENGCEVVLKRGTDMYTADCNEDGKFELSGILLDEGPNVYVMEITDKAGNLTKVDDKIKVIYSKESDVNGDAATDQDDSLPVASGELEDALTEVFGNKLMLIFGIVALSGFMFSSGYVVIKKGKIS